METNIVVNISPPIPYLAKFWSLGYVPKCCQPIKLQDSSKCNISRKKWMMKCIYGLQINIKVFCNSILWFWVCATRNVQSAQNKKCACLCNICRKTWGVKLIFCLQINSLIVSHWVKLIVSHWVCIARHAQSTQNNVYIIFVISKGKPEGWT